MRLPQLTFTRFLAAIAIVFFHSSVKDLFAGTPVYHLIYTSTLFVSYFFVLSGFILVISSPQSNPVSPGIGSPGQFLLNRFARLYPLYLLALVIYLLVKGSDYDFSAFLSTVTLTQAWIPPYSVLINPPGWSLSVELLFYLLFPFLLNNLVKWSSRHLLFLALGAWLANQLLYVYLSGLGLDYRFVLYFPPFHLATFVFGVCLGLLFLRHRVWLTQHRQVLVILTLVSTLVAFGLIGAGTPFLLSFNNNGLLAPVFGLIILSLAVGRGPLIRALSSPVPVLLGEISYGVYLFHVPFSALIHRLNDATFQLPDAPRFVLYLVCVLLFSWFCFEVVEKPSRRYLRSLFAARRLQTEV